MHAMASALDPPRPAPAGAMLSAMRWKPVSGLKKWTSFEMSSKRPSRARASIPERLVSKETLRSRDSRIIRSSWRGSTRQRACKETAKFTVVAPGWNR